MVARIIIRFLPERPVTTASTIRIGKTFDCTREGVVTRNIGEYPVSEFARNVFKYVRKGHVKTDEHWTRNWKRARLIWEIGKEE